MTSLISKNLTELIDWAKNPSKPKEKPSLSDYVKEELKEREPSITLHEKALKGFMKTYRIEAVQSYDLQQFLDISYNLIVSTVNKELSEHKGLKIKLIAHCEMVKTNIATGEHVYSDPHFYSNVEVVL